MANDDNTVLALVPDLMFGTRVKETLRNAGYTVTLVDVEQDAASRLSADAPRLLILDIDTPGLNAAELIVAAKSTGVPVVAFGRHTENQALKDAKALGCAAAVPRSKLVSDMAALVARYARRSADTLG